MNNFNKNILLSGVLFTLSVLTNTALAQDTRQNTQQQTEIEWRSHDGRKLSITAPDGKFSYSVKGGDFIGYNANGTAYRIGEMAVSYNASGKPYRIGTVAITYNANGSVQQVGGLAISYDAKGRVYRLTGKVR